VAGTREQPRLIQSGLIQLALMPPPLTGRARLSLRARRVSLEWLHQLVVGQLVVSQLAERQLAVSVVSEFDELLAEVLAFEQTHKRSWGVLQAVGDAFAIFNLAAGDPFSELFTDRRPIGHAV